MSTMTEYPEWNCTDENLSEAKAIALAEGHISVSMIQRRLRVGYNHGSRILDRMQKEGIVSLQACPNTFKYKLTESNKEESK